MVNRKGLGQANILRTNNNTSTGYGVAYADEVSGHRTVGRLADLYALHDWQLSASGDNTGSDAIGQLWYVVNADGNSNGCYYQLKDWSKRNEAAGWSIADYTTKAELQDKIDNIATADEEDITTEGDTPQTQVLKLKDRAYDSLNASGKGYKILRKNWQQINGERKNVLTQEMINEPNTIYEIRYDFDLNGAEITIQEGCLLKFQGGSLNNGILIGDNTSIKAEENIIFNKIGIKGTWKQNIISSAWFNIWDEKDSTSVLQAIFNLQSDFYTNIINIYGIYNVDTAIPIKLSSNTTLELNSSKICVIGNNYARNVLFHINNKKNIIIRGGTLIGDCVTHIKSSETSSDEWNHLIKISGSSNIYLEGISIKNATGDGIDIIETNEEKTIPTNIYIRNCILDSNRRNNISIEAGCNIYITDCTILNASQINGVSPANGIDIEPWRDFIDVKNVYVKNCIIENSRNEDIQILPNFQRTEDGVINNINIIDCSCKEYRIADLNGVKIVNSGSTNIHIIRGKVLNFYVYAPKVNVVVDNGLLKDSFIENVSSCNFAGTLSNTTMIPIDYAPFYIRKKDLVQEVDSSLTITGGSISSFECNYEELKCIFNNVSFNLAKDLRPDISNDSEVHNCFIRSRETCTYSIKNTYNSYFKGSTFVFDCLKGTIMVNKCTIDSDYTVVTYGSADNDFLVNIIDCYVRVKSNITFKDTYKKMVLESMHFRDILPDTINTTYGSLFLKDKKLMINTKKGLYHTPISKFIDKGTTSQRPVLSNEDEGVEYYDTSLKKKILWNGSSWVNMDGSSLGEQPT